ncbi:zinc ribbon domain-containing protein [Paenisporosarcina sp. TG20]|uniref:TcaA NTF2-like domain-containing protein n=1 Tax=Paenisporosarcina sp. TG20 TaxID=1211706 RepID=UPI0002E82607|nr:zinc ribbon domain-containing protein [Paenisporosarcina sp. TG20]
MELFCQECGSKFASHQNFCPECGAAKGLENQQDSIQNNNNPIMHVKPKKVMSFKKKLVYIMVGIVGIGLIAGHYTIEAKTSPENKIRSFQTAMSSGNSNSILAELTIPDNIIRDDQSFMTYLTSQDIDSFNGRVIEAARALSQDGIEQIIKHENGTDLLKLNQETLFGMYPSYEIQVIPLDVAINIDMENASYQIADQSFDLKVGENSLGKFLPGLYTSTISLKSDVYETSHEEEYFFTGTEEYVIEYLTSGLISMITSTEQSAVVFIDDKPTGKTVKDLSVLGPIFEGDTLVIYAEMEDEEGNIIKTPKVSAKGGEMIALRFPKEKAEISPVTSEEKKEDEDQSEENSDSFNEELLDEFFWNFRTAYEKALNSKDFNQVEYYLSKDTIARNEIEEFIGDIGTDYYHYDFLEDSIIEYDIQGDIAFITTFEEFDFTNHLDVVTNYKRNKRYEVHAPEGEMYQIVKIDILETQRRR